ncbi:MAG: hypothetical protein PHC56_06670 [Herbinix sp.]|nr:hypothetical protein [Herbinix sp.]
MKGFKMKTVFYINGKKVSKKAVTEMVGTERIKRYIKEAKEGFMNDPYEEQSWFLGSEGMLTIEFK